MEKRIKIIIADDNRNFCEMLENYFQKQEDIDVVGIAYNGLEAMELTQRYKPDLVILDLVMPSLDGLGVLERIRDLQAINRPRVILLTAFGQESLIQQALQLGVDFYIVKPFDLDTLYKRIHTLTQGVPPSTSSSAQSPSVLPRSSNVRKERDLAYEVTNLIHEIGIPAHVKGYQYIRVAILMVVEDVSLLGAITKELYPGLAKKFDSEPSRIERGIRHAIALAWDRGQKENLIKVFGFERQKPTNSEFIAVIADKLRINHVNL